MLSPHDNEENLSANELLIIMLTGEVVKINDNLYDLNDITDMIDIETLRENTENILAGENLDLRLTYIEIIDNLF